MMLVVPILRKARVNPGLIQKLVHVDREGARPYLMRVWAKPDWIEDDKGGRAATHFGECQYCGRQQKLPGGVLADHGYSLVWGWRNGTCPGSRQKPFETHTDFLKQSIEDAKKQIEAHKKKIAEGNESFTTIGSDTRTGKTREVKYFRKAIIMEIMQFVAMQEERLSSWKKRPLKEVPPEVTINPVIGLRELKPAERKVMEYVQLYGEVKETGKKWRTNGLVAYDRIKILANSGYLEIVSDTKDKYGEMTVVAKMTPAAEALFPPKEKPIRGGKLVQAMWEKLKAEGELKTKPGSWQQYSTANELAERNGDRVELVESNYDKTYAIIRKK